MTTKTLLERTRDALRCVHEVLKIDALDGRRVPALLSDLDAAIAQQAEPVAYDFGVMGPALDASGIRNRYDAMRFGWDQAMKLAAPQPPVTSGMPEMPEPSFIDGPTETAYYKEDAASADRTACYAAGRRQGLEEARQLCAYLWVRASGADECVEAIDALLQTRGKNDSGVV